MKCVMSGMLVLIVGLSAVVIGQERSDNDPNATTTRQTTSSDTTTGTGTARTSADGTRDHRDEPGFNPGWLGLVGLVGLAGLMPKNRHDDRVHTDHNIKR